MKQFQGGSDAIGGFQSCLPPALTPISFTLLSSMQILRRRERFRQLTRFEFSHQARIEQAKPKMMRVTNVAEGRHLRLNSLGSVSFTLYRTRLYNSRYTSILA